MFGAALTLALGGAYFLLTSQPTGWFLSGTAALVVAGSALEAASGWWPRVDPLEGPWFSDLPRSARRRLSVALWRGELGPAAHDPELHPYAAVWLASKLRAAWRPGYLVFLSVVLGIEAAGSDPASGWVALLWLPALLGPVWVLLRRRWWRTADLLNQQEHASS